jgi:uncharacterized membrane protein YeaQ/YmgE (transglycosylase-associated protein family)
MGTSKGLDTNAMTNLTYFLLIGLAAGWLAGKIIMGRNLEPARSFGVGVVGAVVGGFLLQLMGLVTIGLVRSLITATVVAMVLLFLLQKIRKQWSHTKEHSRNQ